VFFSFLKRRKAPVKLRIAIGGIMIALASLYALAVSYDISMREMSVYLLGSVALLAGTALGAVVLVVVFKLVKRTLAPVFRPLIRRLVAVDDSDEDR